MGDLAGTRRVGGAASLSFLGGGVHHLSGGDMHASGVRRPGHRKALIDSGLLRKQGLRKARASHVVPWQPGRAHLSAHAVSRSACAAAHRECVGHREFE